ncbi:MAG: hypothetical protein WC496_08460 [Phycisphaerae bacterium]
MFRLRYSRIVVLFFVAVFTLTAQATTINIDELSLWAGGTIGFGNTVTVGGPVASAGNISAGNGTSLSSIYTQGNLWLGNNSVVSGNVLANGYVHTGNNVLISGTSVSFGDFVLPPLDSLQQNAVGTNNIYGEKYSTKTLQPGEYRDWSFDKNVTLNLSAGEYNLKNFWMNKDGVVNIDTSLGDVVLNIAGQFDTGKSVTFTNSGSGNLFINVFGHDAWLGENTKLAAVVKVYGGDFGTDSSSDLSGSFYAAGNIWLGNNSQVVYSPVTVIPEPASLALFVMMGFFLSGRKSLKLG